MTAAESMPTSQPGTCSQLGAHASSQSRVIASREELETRVSEVDEEFFGRDVPRPEFWAAFV